MNFFINVVVLIVKNLIQFFKLLFYVSNIILLLLFYVSNIFAETEKLKFCRRPCSLFFQIFTIYYTYWGTIRTITPHFTSDMRLQLSVMVVVLNVNSEALHRELAECTLPAHCRGNISVYCEAEFCCAAR